MGAKAVSAFARKIVWKLFYQLFHFMPAKLPATSSIAKSALVQRLSRDAKAWKNRRNIVNPGLCDQVIQRLAPSLAQYVGCTIIDINPGVGLWSSKLHEYLKPRSHILVESRPEDFRKYLTPYLDAPGSRYVLRELTRKEDPWSSEKYVSEGLLPRLEDWKNQKHEHSPVLIVANLTDAGTKTPVSADQDPRKPLASHRQIIDLVHSARMKSGFQAYGPTRCLIWLPDAATRALMPRTVTYRSKLAVYVESAFHVEEVAAGTSFLSKQREDYLDAESHKLVARRMEENRIETPTGRQPETSNTDALSSKSRAWHQELAELEEGFKNLTVSQFVGEAPAPLIDSKIGHHSFRKDRPTTPEYQKFIKLRAVLKGQNKTIDKLSNVLSKQEEIDRLDLAAYRDGLKHSEQEQEFKVLDAKIKAFKAELAAMSVKDRERIIHMDDDKRAFFQTPHLLSWDRRHAEPLTVQPDEFYQRHELALLDFQPLPPEKQFPLTLDQSIYFDIICTNLFASRGVATLKYLNHLAPGAYEALVPKCPAITDPRKGGRRDVESVRIRNLTPEMLWQLAVAWDEWLFKPEMSDMLSFIGVDSNYWHSRTRHLSRNM